MRQSACNCRSNCTWDTRNNSGNVSGALYNYLQSPSSTSLKLYGSRTYRKATVVSNRSEKNVVAAGRCAECYCRKLPVHPKLCMQPPGYYYSEMLKGRFQNTDGMSFYTGPGNHTKEPNYLLNSKDIYESEKVNKFEDIGVHRTIEDITKEAVEIKAGTEIDDIKENPEEASLQQAKKCYEVHNRDAKEGLGICSDGYSDLARLKDFRSSNYFDCHAVTKDDNESNGHKCIHEFTIDDRLFPIPINSDQFGISRCIICNAQKKLPTVGKHNVTSSKPKQRRSICRSFCRSLSPVSNCNYEDTVIFKLPPNLDISKSVCLFSANKNRIVPVDSIALRHQKFV